jgi:Flp pilus assembly protein TadG
MLVVFLVVQFGTVGLAHQAAQGAAREAARTARAAGGDGLGVAEARGETYARSVGRGFLDNPVADVRLNGDQTVTAQVTGTARTVVPGFGGRVDVSVTGPVEVFRPDG